MTQDVRSGHAAYKDDVRTEWRTAAAGWRKWYPTLEAEHAGQLVSTTLVERAGIGPGDRVLDVAAGYGEPGLTAARAVGAHGHVTCWDISQPMLDFAQERAAEAHLGNIDFIVGDAEQLDLDVDAQRVDAVISRAGIMYFVDVADALGRLRASWLRPGGRLAASVWSTPDKVDFAAPVPVMWDLLELPPPPSGAPGPFALGDATRLAAVVSEAGFEHVETGALHVIYELDSPAAATRWLRDVAPPIAGLVDGRPPDLQRHVWQRVTEAWSPYLTADGRVRLDNEALWVTAQNPD
jgi:enediyne biosynthesis protein CalE5